MAGPLTRFLLLAMTAWLGWTAVLNLPFLPGPLGALESYGWPTLILLGAAAFGFAETLDLFLQRGLAFWPIVALAAITGALALRLALLPFAEAPGPLALVGVREGLGLFAVLYGVAALMMGRTRPQTSRPTGD